MMNLRATCLVILFSVLIFPSLAEAAIVARFAAVNGNVTVRDAKGATRSAQVFGSVGTDETLVLADGASVSLAWLSDSRLERISKPGETKITSAGVEPAGNAALISVPQKHRKLVASGVRALPSISPGAATIARSSEDKPVFPKITPISGSTVLEATPTFSWPELEGAEKYRLRVLLNVDEIWSTEVAKPPVMYAGDEELLAGIDYRWEVTAIAAGKPAKSLVSAQFSIATSSQLQEVKDLQELADSQKDEVAVLALVAMRYEQHRLIAEATKIYEQLAKLSPETAAFHAALVDLYKRAGRSEDAKKSQAIAEKLGFAFSEKVGS